MIKIDLDPGRLAPAEDVSGVIGVFVGLGRGQGLLPIGEHPVTMILRAAAQYRLTVLEVQLPVPAPAASYADLQWARVQLGLQEGGIRRLTPFLSDIHELIAPASGRPHPEPGRLRARNGTSPAELVVGVQTVAEGIPRILNPRPAAANPGPAAEQTETRAGPASLVLPSDLDVVRASGLDKTESASAKTWRVMAIGTDWHGGIESEILDRLDPELGLAGLTAAILNGKAVLLLLAHRQTRPALPPGLPRQWPWASRDSGQDATRPAATVYLDKWQSRQDLGVAEQDPLLRVHMRTPDRPGATLEVLESLRETLYEMAPESLGERDWKVWYARVVVAHGNVAQIQLTVRLALDPAMTPPSGKPVTQWGLAEFSRIERQALALAARKLVAARRATGSYDPGLDAPEDTVISVGLVNMLDLGPLGPPGRTFSPGR